MHITIKLWNNYFTSRPDRVYKKYSKIWCTHSKTQCTVVQRRLLSLMNIYNCSTTLMNSPEYLHYLSLISTWPGTPGRILCNNEGVCFVLCRIFTIILFSYRISRVIYLYWKWDDAADMYDFVVYRTLVFNQTCLVYCLVDDRDNAIALHIYKKLRQAQNKKCDKFVYYILEILCFFRLRSWTYYILLRHSRKSRTKPLLITFYLTRAVQKQVNIQMANFESMPLSKLSIWIFTYFCT